jgi:hypothetical protein
MAVCSQFHAHVSSVLKKESVNPLRGHLGECMSLPGYDGEEKIHSSSGNLTLNIISVLEPSTG